MVEASAGGSTLGDSGTDRALRLAVPAGSADIVGAVLMDLLGPFEQEEPAENDSDGTVVLVFYPGSDAAMTLDDVLAALPAEIRERDSGLFRIEVREVSREWVEGWRAHFHPVVVGAVRIRPPWEPALCGGVRSAGGMGQSGGTGPGPGLEPSSGLVEVVINPGLGFGTGLHPTTRGALLLLQEAPGDTTPQPGGRGTHRLRGPLVDAGTGSGVLAIAAAKMGWAPVLAFENDPVALVSARENIQVNGVQDGVEVREIDVAEAPLDRLDGATVLANMTLEPVSCLLRRLGEGRNVPEDGSGGVAVGGTAGVPAPGPVAAATIPAAGRPSRLVVSGILAGAQERELLRTARKCGFIARRRIYEDEWVSLELLPAPARGGVLALADGAASMSAGRGGSTSAGGGLSAPDSAPGDGG